MDLTEQWKAALARVVVRYPDPRVEVKVDVTDGVMIRVWIPEQRNSVDGSTIYGFTISCVRATYFPGERLAQAWLAAAWAGYIQHEALELVTVDGIRPLDPHAPPYETNPFNRGLRDGLPVELTPETLITALAVVMPYAAAEALVQMEAACAA